MSITRGLIETVTLDGKEFSVSSDGTEAQQKIKGYENKINNKEFVLHNIQNSICRDTSSNSNCPSYCDDCLFNAPIDIFKKWLMKQLT